MDTLHTITIGHAYGTPAGEDLYETVIPDAHTQISELANGYLQAATITEGIGIWEGNREGCTVVSVIGAEAGSVQAFARAAKHTFMQDAVMVTSQEISATYV